MRFSNATVLAALALVAIGWIVSGVTQSAAQAPAVLPMQWEYQWIVVDRNTLNSAGREGWELVTVANTRMDQATAFFKRRLP
jgi:hypothetical protein